VTSIVLVLVRVDTLHNVSPALRAQAEGGTGGIRAQDGPAQAFQVAAESRAFLAERGIQIGGAQTTKTRHARQFFSKQLTPTG
jgi:hypothetical protein